MAQARKTIFSLGGPTYLEDPRVAEAQRSRALDLQAQAQDAAAARAGLEADAAVRRAMIEGQSQQSVAKQRAAQALQEALLHEQGWTSRAGMQDQRERDLATQREGGLNARAALMDLGAFDRAQLQAALQGATHADTLQNQRENSARQEFLKLLTSYAGLTNDTPTALQRDVDAQAALQSLKESQKGGFNAPALTTALDLSQGNPQEHNRLLALAQQEASKAQQQAGTHEVWPEGPAGWLRRGLEYPLDAAGFASNVFGSEDVANAPYSPAHFVNQARAFLDQKLGGPNVEANDVGAAPILARQPLPDPRERLRQQLARELGLEDQPDAGVPPLLRR